MTAYATTRDPNDPDRYQVTEWCHPDERIHTTEGLMCYKFVLQLEVQRWYHKDYRNAWLEADAHGHVAMFTDSRDMVVIDDDSDVAPTDLT